MVKVKNILNWKTTKDSYHSESLLLCVGSGMYYLFVKVAYISETYCKVDFG